MSHYVHMTFWVHQDRLLSHMYIIPIASEFRCTDSSRGTRFYLAQWQGSVWRLDPSEGICILYGTHPLPYYLV